MPTRDSLLLADILDPARNNFGTVRLILALAVVVSHSFYMATGIALTSEPIHAITGYSLGQHAVQLFFVLSGILVTQSLARGGVVAYAKARALRIFPGLAVCVLATALIVGPLVTSLAPAAYFADTGVYRYIAETVLLKTGMAPLPGVFEAHPAASVVNSSLWTLKYEVVCYVLLAAVGGAALRYDIARPVGIAALIAFLWVAAVNPPELAQGNGLIDQIQYFALFFGAGVLAYAIRQHLPLSPIGVAIALVGLAVTNRTGAAEIGHALGLGYIMLWAGSLPTGRLRTFTNRNDYSYGVYIYGVPVGQVLLHAAPGMPVAPLIVATAVISIALAALSWSFVERPSLALRRARRRPTRPRTVVSPLPNMALASRVTHVMVSPRTDR